MLEYAACNLEFDVSRSKVNIRRGCSLLSDHYCVLCVSWFSFPAVCALGCHSFLLFVSNSMHEKTFSFVCPQGDEEELAAAVTGGGKKGRRKPQYSGGLVLDPKRGLILL